MHTIAIRRLHPALCSGTVLASGKLPHTSSAWGLWGVNLSVIVVWIGYYYLLRYCKTTGPCEDVRGRGVWWWIKILRRICSRARKLSWRDSSVRKSERKSVRFVMPKLHRNPWAGTKSARLHPTAWLFQPESLRNAWQCDDLNCNLYVALWIMLFANWSE